jgi:hypothetical protein
MAVTYQLISSNTLASNATSVTFSSIPQTYDDMVIRIVAQVTATGVVPQGSLRFNSDTNPRYRSTGIYWSGTTIGGIDQIASTDTSSFAIYIGSSGGNSQPGMAVVYLNSYASTSRTKSMTWITTAVQNGNSSYYSKVGGGIYNESSTGISTIQVLGNGDTYLAGSTFKLYGIKNT